MDQIGSLVLVPERREDLARNGALLEGKTIADVPARPTRGACTAGCQWQARRPQPAGLGAGTPTPAGRRRAGAGR